MREVPAADRPPEQDIADQRQFRFRKVKYDMAGRVARAVANVEGQFADIDLVTIGQPARRFERSAYDVIFGTVLGKTVDPVTVGLMRPLDRNAKLGGKQPGATAMVDMAVGQQDLFDRPPGLRRGRIEARPVA